MKALWRVTFAIAALAALVLAYQLFFRYAYVTRTYEVSKGVSFTEMARIDRLTNSICVMPCQPPQLTSATVASLRSAGPSFTDWVTALSTFALALLALASAYYARKLWLTSSQQLSDVRTSTAEQLAEMRRSTNTDLMLRILERCDEAPFREAEVRIGELYRDGPLKSYEQFMTYLESQVPEKRLEVTTDINEVLSKYEEIGIVVTRVPSARDLVVEHLALRAPLMLRSLQAVIEKNRRGAPLASAEFERLAEACWKFAESTGAVTGSVDDLF